MEYLLSENTLRGIAILCHFDQQIFLSLIHNIITSVSFSNTGNWKSDGNVKLRCYLLKQNLGGLLWYCLIFGDC